jgi:hypothetical protein
LIASTGRPDPISQELVRNAVTSEAGLFELLARGLEWPMDLGDVDRAIVDWDPSDLGLDPDLIGKFESIRSLRGMNSTEPRLGVFLLETASGDLPVGALRRLLRQVLRRGRSRQAGAPQQFDLDDLMFVVSGTGDRRELHFAAFQDLGGNLPTLRVMSWGADATSEQVRLLAEHSLPRLRWPPPGTPMDEWRVQCRSAFQNPYRYVPKTARELAQQMAAVASLVRDEVSRIYEIETERGPVRALLSDLRENLDHEMTPARFADMYAQTVVYGMLVARISGAEAEPQEHSRSAFRNVFLDAVYGRLGGPVSASEDASLRGLDVDELGLVEFREYLSTIDVQALLAGFGAASGRDDPVIHFYEDFLAEYDPKQREILGAYYTPTPLVRFMVSEVDRELREKFGLPLGVADQTPWAVIAERFGIEIPIGVSPNQPFVSMLDPAAGTGTFLVEWIRQCEENFRAQIEFAAAPPSDVDAAWAEFLVECVLPQMAAFEINMGHYAVAHLKVAMAIPSARRGSTRIPVFLADTLGAPGEARLIEPDDPISAEAVRADYVKTERRITVVIGNPPYRGYSRDLGGSVVAEQTSGSGPRISHWIDPTFRAENHLKHLYNLYTFFWRWATWKCIQGSGIGIVSLVTSSAWLRSPAFPGMRSWLRTNVTDISILEVAGSSLVTDPAIVDENPFDIQIGVACAQVVARPMGGGLQSLRWGRLEGSRQDKAAILSERRIVDLTSLIELGQSGDAFCPDGDEGWLSFPSVSDLFPWQLQGITASRTWVYAPDESTLIRRWETLIAEKDREAKRILFKESSSARISSVKSGLPGFPHQGIPIERETSRAPLVTRVGYRSLDRQYIIADDRVLHSPRHALWSTQSPSQIFAYELHAHPIGPGPGLTFSAHVPEMDFFKGNSGGRAIPLFRDAECEQANILPGLLSLLGKEFELPVTPTAFLAYVACICAHRGYFEFFREELREPGIRIPLTRDASLFRQAVVLGTKILWLQTFGERAHDSADSYAQASPCYAVGDPRRPEVRRPLNEAVTSRNISYDADNEELNLGGGSIAPVPPEVWGYTISGMRVINKWLGYRRKDTAGKRSSPLDDMTPDWSDQSTEELIALITVLRMLIEFEVDQFQLLAEVCAGEQVSTVDLELAGLIPPPREATVAPRAE